MNTEKVRMVKIGGCDWTPLTPLIEANLRGVSATVAYGWLTPDHDDCETGRKCATCFNDECREDRPK